jgi:hypothetical protein
MTWNQMRTQGSVLPNVVPGLPALAALSEPRGPQRIRGQLAPLARAVPRGTPPLATTATAAPPPAIILYGVPADVAAECERVAGELRLARAEVKHLQAACVALKAHPRAMLVASSRIRSWDREVVEEHAARAGTPLRWVDADHTPDDVATEVRSWATDTMRRARTTSR